MKMKIRIEELRDYIIELEKSATSGPNIFSQMV
jgi:hypothetical protein